MPRILPTIVVLLIVTSLLLSGCSKEAFLKEPTQVGVQFVLDPTGGVSSDRLSIDNGYIVLAEMVIEGKREKGEAFTFKRIFPGGLQLDFNANYTSEDLLFDLPQGNYEQLMVHFSTFEQGNTPNWVVKGQYGYRHSSQGNAWIDVIWRQSQEIERRVTTEQGATSFVLDETTRTIKFTIQPKWWFNDISELKLEQATCLPDPRGQVMLIDQTTNDDMFQSINIMMGTRMNATL